MLSDKEVQGGRGMTKGELMNMLCDYSKSYCPTAKASIARNSHMNKYQGEYVPQVIIEVLIVDFVNFVGSKQGMDLGLYTRDL